MPRRSVDKSRRLYGGDCLKILPTLEAKSVDLIYLDPPFNSNADYATFTDSWDWQAPIHEPIYEALLAHKTISKTAEGLMAILGRCGMLAYLLFMAERLLAMQRVLKKTGSIYLHCDPTASHYLKIVMDSIFGADNFCNEIIWHYTGGGRSKAYFSRKHDVIFWYSNGAKPRFNIDAVRVPYKETSGYAKGGIKAKSGKHYAPHPKGTPIDDVWDIPMVNPMAKERFGYPTQKPLTLLERIITASSDEGDVVLDPFCGSGTTLIAAEELKRNWLGIDVSPLAIDMTLKRLTDIYGEEISSQIRLIFGKQDRP